MTRESIEQWIIDNDDRLYYHQVPIHKAVEEAYGVNTEGIDYKQRKLFNEVLTELASVGSLSWVEYYGEKLVEQKTIPPGKAVNLTSSQWYALQSAKRSAPKEVDDWSLSAQAAWLNENHRGGKLRVSEQVASEIFK